MAKVFENKELIQSYLLTTAKYDYDLYEKRILYRIIELLQAELEGKKLNGRLEKNLFGECEVTLPMSSFLKDKSSKHHARAKKALKRLLKKTIEYEDEKIWEAFTVIQNPTIVKYDSYVTFRLHPKIYDVFLDFAKGYRKYELKTAMSFNSVYAMRFYELMSNQDRPITYSIEQLREMLCLSTKYKAVKDFRVRVLDVAKKELDEKSPYTFTYYMKKTGRKYTSVMLVPIEQRNKRDPELEKKELIKQTSTRFFIPDTLKVYLMDQFDFSKKEIKSNIELLSSANKLLDLMGLITEKKRYIMESNNPKGYLISILKKRLNEL